MLARYRRTAACAVLLTSAMCWPSMSAELAVEPSSPAETSTGPLIAREGLGKPTAARTVVSELTRTTASPSARLRTYVAYRATGPSLMLGIGY